MARTRRPGTSGAPPCPASRAARGQTTAPEDLGPYDDETVDAFEVGAKSEFLDRRLRLNAAAFYYDYQDLQVYTVIQ
ncbi:TonB-dependent receptor, partial [Variovorax sp. 2RAF20]